MCSRARNLSLTPVMTAPLDQLRDTRRKDSSTILKPMTATRKLDSLRTLNTRKQLSGTSHWIADSPGSHEGSQNSSERGTTLSPSLYPPPTPPALPPSLPPYAWELPTPSLPVSSAALSSYSSTQQKLECWHFRVNISELILTPKE